MKVFLRNHIPAQSIERVTNALRRHLPDDFTITNKREDADLVIHHVVGVQNFDSVTLNNRVADDLAHGRRYAIIQYCLRSTEAGNDPEFWGPIWAHAACVWSYLDTEAFAPSYLVNHYRAPLGIDPAFIQPLPKATRSIGVMTTGYVSAVGAEAIEEVAIAADSLGLLVTHLGPHEVQGMRTRPAGWRAVTGISDLQLSDLYQKAWWVSGLRYGEGFEFPVIEGLSCGARPIVFDRPDMRRWYDGLAEFVPECSGEELVRHLREVLTFAPEPMTDHTLKLVRDRFNWHDILRGFWQAINLEVSV